MEEASTHERTDVRESQAREVRADCHVREDWITVGIYRTWESRNLPACPDKRLHHGAIKQGLGARMIRMSISRVVLVWRVESFDESLDIDISL